MARAFTLMMHGHSIGPALECRTRSTPSPPGPFEFLTAVSLSFEYLLTNLLFVPFMSGASFNGDVATMTFGFSARSDDSLQCVSPLMAEVAKAELARQRARESSSASPMSQPGQRQQA